MLLRATGVVTHFVIYCDRRNPFGSRGVLRIYSSGRSALARRAW
jgi:hypothetical protein